MQESASAGKGLQDQFGLEQPGRLNRNLARVALIEEAVKRGEGQFAASGAFVAVTGQHTGRSAKDKFIVRDVQSDKRVWWENSGAMSPEQFKALHEDVRAHANGKELFVQDLFGGTDPDYRIQVRVYTEFAWHSLFIQTLLIEPTPQKREGFAPDLTIIDLPSFRATPDRHGCKGETIIGCDFTNGLVLIGGTSYAGEMKKSVFSYLNYVLPKKGVMPMHCSANAAHGGGNTAVFFGLSGTGKTTLSADATRTLIGDDEHGWSENGIFNFEGGCYAKTIRLSPKAEPEISAAVNRFGAILENVILDARTRVPDFSDGSLTENTRGAYKINFISNASATGRSGHPENIVFLTADAFGVMPPIAKLTPEQAMYHFISGYTAKVAGTETGVIEPQAVFSSCFGGPFMALHPSTYGNLLRNLIAEHNVDCWLVNTGWTGGAAGIGHRMPIKATRTLLSTALSGELKSVKMRTDPIFGFKVPVEVPEVDPKILNPRDTWTDKADYDAQANALVEMFTKNFARFEEGVDAEVLAAGPGLREAAE